MYEDMTFENIMDRCLDRVSSSIDKREGSVVYDAIAPAAAELAIMYIELAYLMDRAFPDTESGDDLTKKVRERSIFISVWISLMVIFPITVGLQLIFAIRFRRIYLRCKAGKKGSYCWPCCVQQFSYSWYFSDYQRRYR